MPLCTNPFAAHPNPRRPLPRLLTSLLLLLGIGLLSPAQAQLLLPSTTPVTTDFNSLGTATTATIPTGFQLSAAAAPAYDAAVNFTATTRAAGTTGTGVLTGSSSGGTYNFADGVTATSTDRALGFLSSGGYPTPLHILVAAQNTTGSTITSLAVRFDIEQYRTGTRAFDWQFFTSPDGSTWTEVPAGSQNFPAAGANAVVNPPATTAKSLTLSGLTLAANATTYLRWSYVGTGGSTNSQGLGLDNLVLTASTSGEPAAPTITTGTVAGSPFCITSTGAAVSVPFTTTGTLSGTFSAQLSDAAGQFPTDLTQGLIGTGNSSPVAATIPGGTPAGTGYRIRVLNGTTIGTANPTNLIVNTPPATNSVSLSPSTAQSFATTGQGTPLTATPTAPSTFVWLYSTSATGPFTTTISGATAATYTPKGSDFGPAGSYYLVARATSSCGSVVGISAPVTITTTTPQPTLTFSPSPVPDFGSIAVGGASAAKTVTVTGSNLSQPITITPPAGFQIRTGSEPFSCCTITFSPTGGALNGAFDVRFTPTLAQTYAASLAITSPDQPTPPSVNVSGTGVAPVYPATVSTTTAASAITATTATSGGTIAADGGSPITARGVVYGLSEAPSLADDEFTQDGSGPGTFTSSLVNLAPNSRYYARAYVTTSAGTAYGPQVSFSTLNLPLAAEPTQNPTLTASSLNPRSVIITISGGNGAKHLLLVKQAPELTVQPVDATTYNGNPAFGQGDQIGSDTYVLLAGPARTLTVTGLLPGTEYSFSVFDYNDNNTNGAENYLLTAPGELTLTTPTPPAGLLLSDEFNYPAGDLLTDHGWQAHSGGTTNAIAVSNPGLARTDYGPATGNAAALTASGQDVNRPFAPQEAGTAVYASVLVQVSEAKNADYFLHLGPDPLGSTFRARLFVQAATTPGKLQFGVSGSGTGSSVQFAPTEYDENVPYLLVMRYTFGPSGTETRLYVNPAATTEPTTPDAVVVEAASSAPASIGAIALRQGTNQSPLLLDGLRIATSFEQARPPGTGPLPVTLVSFRAERTATGVRLRWATAQELNARDFQVQRSTDARTFTTVATVPAAGTTASARTYSALDTPPVTPGPLYYRLKQNDLNGTAHFSNVVALVPAGAELTAALTVAPNPANSGAPLTLTLRGRAGQDLRLEVLDATGRVHHTQPLRPSTSSQQLSLQLPAQLPAGLYLLRVTAPGTAPLQARLVLTR